MRLALLKAPLPGLKHQLAHRIGSAIDHSQYSHSNIVFANGQSGSAWSDGGVQIKRVDYVPGLWDFYSLPKEMEPLVHARISHLRGISYDHLGVMRFGVPLLKESQMKFFCHELLATAFGWSDAWRYGPGMLLARCKDQFHSVPFDGPFETEYQLHEAVKAAMNP